MPQRVGVVVLPVEVAVPGLRWEWAFELLVEAALGPRRAGVVVLPVEMAVPGLRWASEPQVEEPPLVGQGAAS